MRYLPKSKKGRIFLFLTIIFVSAVIFFAMREMADKLFMA